MCPVEMRASVHQKAWGNVSTAAVFMVTHSGNNSQVQRQQKGKCTVMCPHSETLHGKKQDQCTGSITAEASAGHEKAKDLLYKNHILQEGIASLRLEIDAVKSQNLEKEENYFEDIEIVKAKSDDAQKALLGRTSAASQHLTLAGTAAGRHRHPSWACSAHICVSQPMSSLPPHHCASEPGRHRTSVGQGSGRTPTGVSHPGSAGGEKLVTLGAAPPTA
ncbi:unnamed protein product [Rangifer tarandus platyrhynchus]|uniref:CCDC144C-like coiled-coil domain-containing protein n=1 Tax=Rangifer tarandus platyrhynchus TaxID=3082113 RepID=A0ABN8Y070_RANTA|nr:unnamed protein product [Rangifer tarandus platyrhynchus]